MPIYDFECISCNQRQERIVPYDRRHAQYCDICQAPMDLIWTAGHTFIPFKERSFPGFPGSPFRDVVVSSKKQLRELCKQHDCKSVYLEDS